MIYYIILLYYTSILLYIIILSRRSVTSKLAQKARAFLQTGTIVNVSLDWAEK